MPVLTSTISMSREEWLQTRKMGIGGSDAAAIAGLNPWRSPLAVYLDKVGELPDTDNENEAMYWGSVLEDVVAKEFSQRTGFRVQRRNAMLQHPEHSFMLANVDRFIFNDRKQKGILEVKTAGAFNSSWDDEKLPDYVALQVHHYLAVTGLSYAYVAVLIGGQQCRHHLIERDQEVIDYLIKIESDFWKLVENRTPPEADGSESSTEALSLLYKNSMPGSEVDLPPTAYDLIKTFEDAKQMENEYKIIKDEASNKIKAILGENEVGHLGDKLVTWKPVSTNRLDSKLLQEEHPSIYERYLKTTTSRRFAVK